MKPQQLSFWLPVVCSLLLSLQFTSTAQSYRLEDLGATLGTNSYALGINNESEVVGYWFALDGAHAFLYQPEGIRDLGFLGSTNNYALSINDYGQIVGFADTKPLQQSLYLDALYASAMWNALLFSKIVPHAAELFEHYLDNVGTDFSINLQEFLNDVKPAKALYNEELELAKNYASKLPDGTHLITSRVTSPGTVYPDDSKDWFLAIEGYVVWGKGKVTVCSKRVTMEFTFRFKKRYQWEMNAGKAVWLVADREVGKLAAAGYAQEFNVKGEKKETLTWIKP